MKFNPQPKPEKKPKKVRKGISKKKAYDEDLWDVFSVFIRLRFSDDNGYCSCITCGSTRYWKGQHMQAGHGIERQHWGTRYNLINVQVQCAGCNKFKQGAADVFKEYVNKKHGPNTWDTLKANKDGKKLTTFEMYYLQLDFQKKIEKLAEDRGIPFSEYKTKGWIKTVLNTNA